MAEACSRRPLVDRHFQLQTTPEEERALREHLPGCESCGARYARQLVLARIAPSAPSAEDRLGAGLGFGRRKRAQWGIWVAAATALAASAAVAVQLRVGAVEDAAF